MVPRRFTAHQSNHNCRIKDSGLYQLWCIVSADDVKNLKNIESLEILYAVCRFVVGAHRQPNRVGFFAICLLPRAAAVHPRHFMGGILCYVTWPWYERLRRRFRPAIASLAMVVPISLVLFTPFAAAAITLTNNMTQIMKWFAVAGHEWPPPPAWLLKLPFVGQTSAEFWQDMGQNTRQLIEFGRQYVIGAGSWIMRQSINLGAELVHMGLSILVLFFCYRDGEKAAVHAVILIQKLAGEQTQRIVHILRSTLRAVVYGIIGTALVQALASVIGLIMAGLPYPYVLGVVAFFLAIIPMGLTLLWLPAAAWLLMEGQTGWAIFIVVWFALFVGTIDNWLRPILISREVELHIVLIVFGIFGGILSFGFIGVFLGPTLLSTGFAIVADWIIYKEKKALLENAAE